MGCAGCDDCPQDAWHLHVTVQPHRSWGMRDTADAIVKDTETIGTKLVRVTNTFRTGHPVRNYVELIPTLHLKGTEAEATWKLFNMAHRLSNNGWHIRRLKIEGDASKVQVGRALYFESHVKIQEEHVKFVHSRRWPVSRTTNNIVVTVRDQSLGVVMDRATQVIPEFQLHRVEACVLDSNPTMDREWLAQ